LSEISFLLELITAILSGGVTGFILSLLSKVLKRKRKQMEQLTSLIAHFGIDPVSIEAIIEKTLESEERDLKATFIILTVEIEKSLRSLAISVADFGKPVPIHKIVALLVKYEVVEREWEESFQRLWDTRNKVIHGMSVSDDEIELGTKLAVSLLITLERIGQKWLGSKRFTQS